MMRDYDESRGLPTLYEAFEDARNLRRLLVLRSIRTNTETDKEDLLWQKKNVL